jgi:hypothetical protein
MGTHADVHPCLLIAKPRLAFAAWVNNATYLLSTPLLIGKRYNSRQAA